jgi:HD superfamily phosphohydrolase
MMSKRIFSLPEMHDFDLAGFESLINHPLFQKLHRRRQLGTSFLAYPGAQHSRFLHCLATLSLQCERNDIWIEHNFLGEPDSRDLAIASMLRDIGHGPYSHVSESLASVCHKTYGLQLLEQLRPAIESCQGNFTRIYQLLEHTDPLHKAFSHHPLGTDKLAYLFQDALHTHQSRCPTLGPLLHYVYWNQKSNQVCIDPDIVLEVCEIQQTYAHMYQRVYCHPDALIAQYFLQKITRLEIKQGHSINPDTILEMTDDELDGCLQRSSVPAVRLMHDRFATGQLPKKAVVIKPDSVTRIDSEEDSYCTETLADKDLQIFAGEHGINLQMLEHDIARRLSLDGNDLLVVPVFEAKRFRLPDIPIARPHATPKQTLRSFVPKHYESLEEMARNYQALLVCVPDSEHERLAQPHVADTVCNLLLKFALT